MGRGEEGVGELFPPTDWETLSGAGGLSEAERRCQTLSRLWPRYARGLERYLHQRFHLAPEAIEDVLQSFVLEKILRGDFLAEADRQRGRFRTFLLSSLENHALSLFRSEAAAKRRPERGWIPFESMAEEEHPDGVTRPDRDLDWAWASAVLEKAAMQMRAECLAAGREDIWRVFEARGLEALLHGRPPVAYKLLARQQGHPDPQQTRLLFHSGKRMFRRAVETVLAELVPDEARRQEEFEDVVAILFNR